MRGEQRARRVEDVVLGQQRTRLASRRTPQEVSQAAARPLHPTLATLATRNPTILAAPRLTRHASLTRRTIPSRHSTFITSVM